jgi:predicted nucleic acid-binding protein
MCKDIYVLDACALIAFFNDELGAVKIEHLFEKALHNEIEVFMLAVNLCEVYYDCLRAKDLTSAETLLQDVNQLPISIIREITDDLLKEAGRFKVDEKVSFADSFALAFARIKHGKLVTTDHHEFDEIDKKGSVEFYWLR